jgi:16S rRNA (guanine527-N7)-methyltransferase
MTDGAADAAGVPAAPQRSADGGTAPGQPAEVPGAGWHPSQALLEKHFGSSVPRVVAYADRLVSVGVERGLLGPREAPRVWDRHIFNCVTLASLVPDGSRVCDLGSGAGLPGVVLALARPDVHVTLLEPLLRRTIFLQETVEALELPNAAVLRARAEEVPTGTSWDVVTARAVAPLDRLAAWAAPLLQNHGLLLALKGSTVAAEVASSAARLSQLGAASAEVVEVSVDGLPPTHVVRTTFARPSGTTSSGSSGQARGRARRKPQ